MSKKADPKSSLKHFWAGAVPAAAAVLLVLVHTLQPVVAHEQQPLLYTVADWLISISLAVWVWCVVRDTACKFEARDEAADKRQQLILEQIADNHAEAMRAAARLERAVQASHRRLNGQDKRLDTVEEQANDFEAELEHLREMIIQNNLAALGKEQLGPRPIGRQPS